MGIQNYLKRVSTATKNIKSAIEEKGVPVSQCDGLEVLADKVRQIQTGSSQMFMMLAFKQSDSAPAVPTGGYFSDENITYPTGWSDGAGLTENIWMSYAIINSDGSFYKDWVTPIKISNEGKEIDLTDYALKSWVSAEIAKIQTGGTVDLSNYYTKSEIDSKIPGSVVSSINGLNGDVVLQGSSTVTITSSDNKLIFTANGGGSEPSESYISCRLYTVSNSKETAPEIPESNVSWDLETKTLINLPTGWRKKAIATAATPYVWEIVGNFSTSTGLQIGDWDGPNCLSGNDGDPGTTGPKGEDGDSWEEVYAASDSADTPTIDSTTTDSNGKTKKDDGYLPTFVFGSIRIEASTERPSTSDTNRYVWGTKRRGKTGNWSDFYLPYIMSTFIDAGLTEEDKQKIIQDVTTSVGEQVNEANKNVDAIKARVDAIDFTDASFIRNPDNALISAITQYKDADKKSFADLVVDGKEARIRQFAGAEFTENGKTYLSGAGVDVDGLNAQLKQFATFKNETEGTINNVQSTLDAQDAKLTQFATNISDVDGKVSSAQTQLDGLNATVTTDTAKSRYWWVKYKETDIDGTNKVTEVSEKTDYDLSNVGTGKTYATKEAYESAMTSAGWTKELIVDALSRISQEAGKITLAAKDGSSWSSIVAKANADSGSDICLNADRINLTGKTLAEKISANTITVHDLNVTDAKISNSTITSCEIQSQIKSSNYSATEKTGFLLDAKGTDEGGKGAFALYADGAEITNDHVIIPAANVTGKLTASQIDADNLHVKAANVDGVLKTNEIEATIETSEYTKKSTMNAENFKVTVVNSDGSSGEIYIGIAPEYTIDSKTYTNMPVLYMSYKEADGSSTKRYLDPKMWIQISDGSIYVKMSGVTYYTSMNNLAGSNPIEFYKRMIAGTRADELYYTYNSVSGTYEPYNGTAFTVGAFNIIDEIPEDLGELRVIVNSEYVNKPSEFGINICRPDITKHTFTDGVDSTSNADQAKALYMSAKDTSGQKVYIKLSGVELTDSNMLEYPGHYSDSPLIGTPLSLTTNCYKLVSGNYVLTSMPSISAYSQFSESAPEVVKLSFNNSITFHGTQDIAGAVPTEGWDYIDAGSAVDSWDEQLYYDAEIN